MRRWIVARAGEPADVLGLVEDLPPSPADDQVHIRVHAAAVGLPDVFMCRGVYPLTPPTPFTPGQEVCGTDVATGERVVAVTDFVHGNGGFAEETLAAATNVF